MVIQDESAQQDGKYAGLIWVTTILNWKFDCLKKESTTERATSFGILIQNCNNIEISESRLWCWNSKITELEGVLLAKNFIQKSALPYKKRHTCWNPVWVWLHNTYCHLTAPKVIKYQTGMWILNIAIVSRS